MLAAKRGNAEEALQRIGNARNALGPELAAMVTENYDRSYGGMVRVQQLTELEEVIEYAELGRVAAAAYVGGGGGNGGGGNDNPPPRPVRRHRQRQRPAKRGDAAGADTHDVARTHLRRAKEG